MRWMCALILTTLTAFPASSEEIRNTAIAEKWLGAFPLANAHLGAMAFTGTASDRLMLFLPASPSNKAAEFAAGTPAETVVLAARKAGQEQRFSWLAASAPKENLADVWLDWLDGDQPARDFSSMLAIADGVVTTKFTRGTSGLTGRVFISEADDLTVIHLRADKPGALNFKVRLERKTLPAATPRVEDRRILILHGKTGPAEDTPAFEVRAWVFPMESEVTPAEKDISVLGEGEALILIATAAGPENSPALSQIGSRMQKYGFGGEEHPDISLLWEGLLERHLKAHRALMAEKK
jgi:hypothetical protein